MCYNGALFASADHERSLELRSSAASRRRQRTRRTPGCWPRVGVLIVLAVVAVGLAQVVYWIALAGHDAFNILVLGLDERPQEIGPSRSDVIMLVGLNPDQHTVGLLSIPRDLFVWIPGQGEGRINTAHFWGEVESPGGGPALIAETIHQNLGVPVHGYVRLNFQGFVEVVDALGGVTIDVPEEIHDARYPTDDLRYTNITIPAGRQKMDGQQALIYVRTRYGYSDIDRVRRQQQVVAALLRRAASPAGWLRLPAAVRAVRNSVDTDLGLGEMLLWGAFAVRSGLDVQDRIVLDGTVTFSQMTEDGSWVLLPDWNRILPLMQRFGGGEDAGGG
jgi:LCP family protein required for cell wall assembly